MTEPEYIAYFEYLASQHSLINHNPETDRKAFYVVHEDNYSELDAAVRNELSLPALLLDQYYDDLNSDSDNNRLVIQGGLSVICKFETGNTLAVRAARDQARRIARAMLNRLKVDCRPGGALIEPGPFSFLATQPAAQLPFPRFAQILVSASAQGEPTPVIGGNAAGWGYSFTLQFPTQVALVAGEWLDRQ